MENFLVNDADKDNNIKGLIIDKKCNMLIQGFNGKYKYKKDRNGGIGLEPVKDEWSHIHDAMQYACLYWSEGSTNVLDRLSNKEYNIEMYKPSDGHAGY